MLAVTMQFLNEKVSCIFWFGSQNIMRAKEEESEDLFFVWDILKQENY